MRITVPGFKLLEILMKKQNILVLSNNPLKGLTNWKKELQSIKINFEHLEMIYKVAPYNEDASCRPTDCKNSKALQ